jgi:hypothetical protein
MGSTWPRRRAKKGLAMAEEIQHPDGRIEHPSVRHEPTDVRFGPIAYVLLGATVFGVVVLLGIGWLFAGYRTYQARSKESPFPLAPAPSTALPPEPRLEQIDRNAGIQRENVYVREATKEELLRGYGPTNEEGFIHIPIDRAMTLLEKHLPARAQPSAERSRREGGLVDAGEPNSGRVFRRNR